MKMKTKVFFRNVRSFFRAHRTLVVFTVLFFVGLCIGVRVFGRFGSIPGLFESHEVTAVNGGVGEALQCIFSAAFSGWLLLLCLYVMGLSPCGIPTAAIVSLFYGMGVGLSLAQQYANGVRGVLFSMALIVPRAVLCVAALLIGCCETVRMSALVGQQFFRSDVHSGMASDFRLYSLRFLILSGLVLLSAVVDFVLRLIFYPLF